MYPTEVKLVEVGPRDGLQNEHINIPVSLKLDLIQGLVEAGLKVIETGSFVSKKWVPQMADSGEVFSLLKKKAGVSYPVLVPNLKGLDAALEVGVKEVAVFASATEAFSQRNINCSVKTSLERFYPVIKKALENEIKVRGYVSVVLGCPYEGNVSPSAVSQVAEALYDMGCYEISIGDTIGVGTPLETKKLIEKLERRIPVEQIAGHFHDTYGQALPNILTAMENGVGIFDTSVGGLGGCPYAEGATGNVATEDVLYMLDGMGVATGISMEKLLDVSNLIMKKLNKSTVSRVSRALLAKRENSSL